jgi:predicted MFS family arabinose efflux permease
VAIALLTGLAEVVGFLHPTISVVTGLFIGLLFGVMVSEDFHTAPTLVSLVSILAVCILAFPSFGNWGHLAAKAVCLGFLSLAQGQTARSTKAELDRTE